MADGPRIGVVSFPASCDDRDACRAVEVCGGRAVPLWHADGSLADVDGVILPGGFSYGDHLRCGALAARSPIMDEVRRFAASGGPVLGICNGFQILCEAGLLPGVLTPNHGGRFVARDVDLVVVARSPWTGALEPGARLRIPIKHHDGAWYAPPDDVARLEAEGRILLRYAEETNGAAGRVAGVLGEAGNVVGLMPHPEHAVEPLLGSDDGRSVIGGLLAAAAAAVPV